LQSERRHQPMAADVEELGSGEVLHGVALVYES
jgi:hypothetical protein